MIRRGLTAGGTLCSNITHTHTHTHIYIYIYTKRAEKDIKR